MMKRIVYLSIFILVCSLSYAQDHKSADAIIVSDNITFDVASPSSGTMKAYRKVMVMNRKGLNSATFHTYIDSFRSLTSFSGRIEAGGKTLRKLKSSDLTTVLVAEGITSDASVSFYEPSAPYPFIVEYEYEVSYKKGFIAFPMYAPVSEPDVAMVESSYSVSVPEGMRIQYSASADPVKSSQPKKDVYRWSFDRYPGYREEHIMPDEMEMIPYVYAGPVDFEYSGVSGSQAGWKEVGTWLAQLQNDVQAVPTDLKTRVEGLLHGLTDERTKVKALYDFLRENTRYVSIQLGIGGYKPFPVETVYKTGFGDCKALSVYMKALLSLAGINSEYFIINTDNPDLLPGFHSVGQMNHAMLCVPMESDTLWVECTNPRYPLGYRHNSLAGHQVLLVKEDGGELVRVRDYPDSLRLRSEKVDVELRADGSAECRGKRRLLLDNVESYIGFRALDSKARFDVVMAGNSLNPVDFSITSVEDNFNDWTMMAQGDEYIPEFKLGYAYEVKDYGKASGERIFMDMNPFAKRMYSDRTARANDMEVDEGMTVIDSISVRLPAGYIPESLPSCNVVESQFGLFKTEVSYDEDAAQVEVIQSLVLHAGRFPKDSYPDYRTFARSVSRSYDGKIVLIKKQ